MYFHNQLIILYSSSPYIISFFLLTILFTFAMHPSTMSYLTQAHKVDIFLLSTSLAFSQA